MVELENQRMRKDLVAEVVRAGPLALKYVAEVAGGELLLSSDIAGGNLKRVTLRNILHA
jgi:hypothetical protein